MLSICTLWIYNTIILYIEYLNTVPRCHSQNWKSYILLNKNTKAPPPLSNQVLTASVSFISSNDVSFTYLCSTHLYFIVLKVTTFYKLSLFAYSKGGKYVVFVKIAKEIGNKLFFFSGKHIPIQKYYPAHMVNITYNM